MRAGNVGFPAPAIRTHDFLYIRNFEPARWPIGDPENYGDIVNSPSKEFVIEDRQSPQFARFFELACNKKPEEELYDIRRDPGQLDNVAGAPKYTAAKKKLRGQLDDFLRRTGDPRLTEGAIIWDTTPYYGAANPQVRGKSGKQ
mgnify:CR=1 FL=1